MKSGKLILISKIACIPAVVVLGISVWMFLQPFQDTLIVVTCVFLGVFSLGIYPVMLELSVEATYPLDESVVTGLCYLSSAIQVQFYNYQYYPRVYIEEQNYYIVYHREGGKV